MLKSLFCIGIFAFGCLSAVVNATFQSECLNAHNRYRAKHGIPQLVLDNNLQNVAQGFVDQLAQYDLFQHSGNGYGENIYFTFGSANVNGDMPVKAWYDEIVYYNWSNPGLSMQTRQFTQVVWKNSRALGCAIAAKGNKAYVVANYNPPGNYKGQFPQNVLPAK